VSFEAPTAAMSAAVTNELVTMILDQNVSLRTGAASQTLAFFSQEVERLDRDLATKGGEILRFKQANSSALPDSLDFRRSQQAAEQERLLQLQRDEAALKDRRQRLVTLYETTGTIETPTENLSPAQKQLQELRDQLAQALIVYAPQNPRVKVLEGQVAAAEKVVASQVGAVGSGANAPSAYDIQLADIDGQLAFMAEEKAQIETKLAALNTSIEATPANAITLGTLERDFANLRAQYDAAVANKARAETGDLIETMSKGQRISIIEQAVAPREPARPNRIVIAAAGVGGGLVLGLALVVLLELMNRAIRRPVDLTGKLGITPFATLPYMRTRGESRRRSLIIALALLVVLVGIPAGLWAIDTYYLPIDMIIDRLIDRLGLTDLVAQTRQSLGQ
jgi:uncharacterized protein involved in exopolysaccharide biosynthesis